MHIPDGFLDARTAALTSTFALAGLTVAVRRTQRSLPPRQVPLMGLAAAFVFAAQMLNFPIPGGTSGHLVGGVLVSVLLGPSPAVLVLASVLIVQCFIFADGGVLALGANILNMGLICSVGGYAVYRLIHRVMPGQRGRLVAVAFASWVSTVTAAIACAGQLALSHRVAWAVGFPAMAGVHMLIGVGEAVITTLVIFAITNSRPELLQPSTDRPLKRDYTEAIGFGLLISLALAVFVSPFASRAPDGLEHVAEKFGFIHNPPHVPAIASPLAEYQVKGIESFGIATAVAGGIGTVVVFGLSLLLARMLVRDPRSTAASPAAT